MASGVAHGNPTAHLPAATVAAYLQGELDTGSRAEAETHLASCTACRHEVVAVGGLLATRRRRRMIAPALGLAAAAVLALAVGLPTLRRHDESGATVTVRAPVTPAAHALATITPAADTILPASHDLQFAWHAVPGGSTYRVMLLGESGERLWSTETGDTVALLPDDVRLAAAASYFWYVDALTGDGTARTSGARRFSVR